MEYLSIEDFLLVAEGVLSIPADTLAKASRLDLADSALHAPQAGFGDVEFYPEMAMKTAVLGWHIIRNHPLPDGNKRTGYGCMREFVLRNGHQWRSASPEETETIIVAVAAGEMDEESLAHWIAARIDG